MAEEAIRADDAATREVSALQDRSGVRGLLKLLGETPRAGRWTEDVLARHRAAAAAVREIASSRPQEVRASGTFFTKPEKILLRALCTPDPATREALALALDSLGAVPTTGEACVYYRVGKKDWARLGGGGPGTLTALYECLEDRDAVVRTASYRAIVKILAKVGREEPKNLLQFMITSQLMRTCATVSGATATLKGGLRGQLARAPLSESSEVGAAAAAAAFCENRQYEHIGAVIDWACTQCIERPGPVTVRLAQDLAERPEEVDPACPATIARALVPAPVLQRLVGDYAEIVLDLFAWEAVPEVKASRLEMLADTSRCVGAIERLSRLKTPAAMYLLGLVADRSKTLTVSDQPTASGGATVSFDFRSVRELARNALESGLRPKVAAISDPAAWRLVEGVAPQA